MSANIYVTELSASRHTFHRHHFCRGNSNRRKSRLGVIEKGYGSYIYLGKKLDVREGDVVFIPENVYCYSEWHGTPEIEVTYISCFMHHERYKYVPQTIDVDERTKGDILQIARLLSMGEGEQLEAYSMFYHLLGTVLRMLRESEIVFDKTLKMAIEYITTHASEQFSIGELAKNCCVSESTLYHLFSRELGQSPVTFLQSIRINYAIDYLENSNYSISTISQMAGFPSENHFRKVFRDFTGTTPLKYRKGR
ncbi:MAG: helix-turn-helix transcriptional regulator [Clostridia bacterium]|nr:helix-turn-helix transcriptional regulator [Clostridia bacterium]